MNKPILKNSLIFFPLHAQLDDGCDYAVQTFKQLSKDNLLVVLLLSDPLSWKDLPRLLTKKKNIVEQRFGAKVMRPFFLIPFQRVGFIKELNIAINSFFLSLFLKYFTHFERKICWFFEVQYIRVVLPWFKDFFCVFDAVDHFFVHPDQKNLRNYVFQHSDLVATNSQTLFKEYKNEAKQIIQVPLGFSPEIFDAELKNKPLKSLHFSSKKLVIGYVGGLSYRFDFSLLEKLVHRFPKITFRFIGPIQLGKGEGVQHTERQINTLLSQPNVEYLPKQPKLRVPHYIAAFDLCLIPYDLSYAFNQKCFPMKFMEYLYLGKPVLSTPISELKHYKEVTLLGKNSEEFSANIKSCIKNGWTHQQRKKQRGMSLEHTWQKKITAITEQVSALYSSKLKIRTDLGEKY